MLTSGPRNRSAATLDSYSRKKDIVSYFIAGSSAQESVRKELEQAFRDVVPPAMRADVLRIKERRSFISSYGNQKAIDNVLVCDAETGSWLALLGTPLTKASAEREKLAFLQRVLADLKHALNDEIDGSFALLAYDAHSDTLSAAADCNNTNPIYYATSADGVYLCSHELPLARALQTGIDPLGFALSIHLKNTWGTLARYKGIRRLLPCQIVSFHGNTTPKSEIYWRPSEEAVWRSNLDVVIDQWLPILKESVQAYHGRAKNKEVICDFTGGEDSRLLLSTCHALGIPFRAQVTGQDGEVDVVVTKKITRKVAIPLIVRPKHFVSREQVLQNAIYICLMHDACEEYSRSCTDYATDTANPVLNYTHIKYCGVPGGEAYRGSYYLRGKALFPESTGRFDYRFFTRMKYLLDFHAGLMRVSDDECKNFIFALVERALEEVSGFPMGTKIDHLLREFQTCYSGLVYKNPRYLPFASSRMTRSIYNLPPRFKQGGKLTRACTEILYPELAVMKTEKGVPTIRKTLLRSHQFLPEHLAFAKCVFKGAVSRAFRLTDSNKWYYKWSLNAPALRTLLMEPPYAQWFSSAASMRTGGLYDGNMLESLLADAKSGSSKYVPILGRIINQELACRWVNRDV